MIRAGLAEVAPSDLSGEEATSLVTVCVEAERLLAAAKARFSRRVAETDAHRRHGHRTATDWLAAVSGSPVSQARDLLQTAERVAAHPDIEAAWARGDLSTAQAKLIQTAAVLDPSATTTLLRTALGGSFADIKATADQIKHRARGDEGERAREQRAHAGRFCRVWEPETGGLRIDAWLTKRDGGRLLARLEAETDAVFKEARSAGRRQLHERYRADALVRLVTAAGCPGGHRHGPEAHVVVRVDAAALRRGATEGDEVCEIAGLGPVPVATARELLGDSFFNLLVTDGIDVLTITSQRRTIPAALRVALADRDPTCVVPGCAVATALQIDHWRLDFADGGPTELANLARLCAAHHHLKTHAGWRLTGGPGRWGWQRPAHRPAGRVPRTVAGADP
ncbi:MAG TPA: hypothetical protein VHW47_05140 [Acidimicrobiales bacterium]|nr:hypothetical protein [Acidimicrobiales bacterium]